ncbi:uncharacterized protein [Euphorbia lathyris]|uniref:uncharacterized protein n=1 Tax=Euphorbia lathyris TaxID=212925 RepID=UPI0033135C06
MAAVTIRRMSILIATLGILSFIFGVVGENKKPAAGTPITGKGVVICKYPSDPMIALGYLSFGFLVASAVAGFLALFYPYKGKSVPQSALWQSTTFVVFFNVAIFTTGLALTLVLWPTITEHFHLTKNVHHNLQTECPTAKTGVLGGGAFLSLDSALFWLIALMLANNAREDYLEGKAEFKNEFGMVITN